MISFETLPASWELAPIGDVASVNPRSFSAVAGNDSLSVHFVPMSAVAEEFNGIDTTGRRPLGEVKKGYTSFLPNDVIFAKITPCMENGKVAVVPELPDHVAFGSTEFHVLRCSDALAPKWLAWFISQAEFRKFARQNMTGSAGQMRVPTVWLSAVEIPVPPLSEQARVIEKLEELLSDLDAGVAELKAARKKLDLYRQSLLKSAVEGALTAAWREQRQAEQIQDGEAPETGEQLLRRILAERRARWEAGQRAAFLRQDKAAPRDWQTRYPEPVEPQTRNLSTLSPGWVWASLDMLGEVVGGLAKGTKRNDGVAMREVPYLRVANVQRGYLDLDEIKTIPATERDVDELTLRSGDVLFNEGGDRDKLGRGWVWRDEIAGCIHQNHVFRFRAFLSDTVPELVSHYGNTFGKIWFQQAGKQTTNLASISLSILRAFPVPVAPAIEQQAILEILNVQLDALRQQEQYVERALRQAAAQRRNILKAAFSGQLVPQHLSDEPASTLLERIRANQATAGTNDKKRNRKAKALS